MLAGSWAGFLAFLCLVIGVICHSSKFAIVGDSHLLLNYDPNAPIKHIHCRGNGSVEAANEYGKYGCDTPVILFNATLDSMLHVIPDPDFIVYIGDFVAHHTKTQDEVYQNMARTAQMLRDAYPKTLVFPLLGNEDFFPDYISTAGDSWFTKIATNLYPELLGVSDTFKVGGYYSHLLPGSSNKLLVLNTVLYSRENPAAANESDPGGQLEWLKWQLEDAQSGGYKVFLFGHIPTGVREDSHHDQWHKHFSDAFVALIVKYAPVISSTFFGHTHRSSFRFYSTGHCSPLKKVEMYSIMIGAVSPIRYNNPSFTTISYDLNSMALHDYAVYNASIDSSEFSEGYSFMKFFENSGTKITLASMQTLWDDFLVDKHDRKTMFHLRNLGGPGDRPYGKATFLCGLSCHNTHDHNDCLNYFQATERANDTVQAYVG